MDTLQDRRSDSRYSPRLNRRQEGVLEGKESSPRTFAQSGKAERMTRELASTRDRSSLSYNVDMVLDH